MKRVLIRRCPVCDIIAGHVREVEIALRRHEGVDVEVIDGHMGEFTVMVNGVEVVRKDGDLPSVETVMMAIESVASPAECI